MGEVSVRGRTDDQLMQHLLGVHHVGLQVTGRLVQMRLGRGRVRQLLHRGADPDDPPRVEPVERLSGLTVSSSSFAPTVAPSVRIVPPTALARARVWGVSAVSSAATRDSVVGAGPSCAAPMPSSATRPAQYGWSAPCGTITCGAPTRAAVVVVPAPPWCTTAATRENSA